MNLLLLRDNLKPQRTNGTAVEYLNVDKKHPPTI